MTKEQLLNSIDNAIENFYNGIWTFDDMETELANLSDNFLNHTEEEEKEDNQL